jgi:O-antigen/teichoic acid export membrane protein
LTIGCGALTISGVLLLAPVMLPLLGNFMDARTLLIWLAVPSFVMSFYATADRLLIIAGQANVALVVTALSFVVLLASPFATAPWLGPVAIPAAMITSMLCFSPIIAVYARQLVGVRTLAPLDCALMACGCIALAGSAVADSYLNTAIMCGLLGAIGVYYVTTATSRSAATDYDDSLIFRGAGSSANAPLLAPDKASK